MDEPKKQPKETEQPVEPASPELPEAALKQVTGGTKETEAPTDYQDYYKIHLEEQ
jgi:hypothetical protein